MGGVKDFFLEELTFPQIERGLQRKLLPAVQQRKRIERQG
jgi:hypothetical protein